MFVYQGSTARQPMTKLSEIAKEMPGEETELFSNRSPAVSTSLGKRRAIMSKSAGTNSAIRIIVLLFLVAAVSCVLCAGALVMSTPENSYAATGTPGKVKAVKIKKRSASSITVSWAKAKRAKSYRVAYKKPGKHWKYKTTKARSKKIPKLADNSAYYVKVRAKNGKKKGAWSSKKKTCTFAKTPAKVMGLSISMDTDTSLDVSWSKSSNADRYLVAYKEHDSSIWKTESTASKSLKLEGLDAGTTYDVKVRGVNTGVSEKPGSWSKTQAEPTEFDAETINNTMLELINEERRSADLDPLELYSPIEHTAQEKAEDMYSSGTLDHYSDNLGSFYDQFDAINMSYSGGGENILYGFTSHGAELAMKTWMNSPGHKANILNANYTHVGIGYYKGYWVQQFATNPSGGAAATLKTGMTVTCASCGTANRVEKFLFYSHDAEGNTYGCIYCSNCGRIIEKCPKCETGVFADIGLTDYGSVASQCNVCGDLKSKSCHVTCDYCGAKLLDNTKHVEYTLEFNSRYAGRSHYYQAFVISVAVCKSCGKIALVTSPCDHYSEFYEKLKETLGTDEDIFHYITWKKVVGYKKVSTDGNTTTFESVYETIPTPHILNSSELLGMDEL